MSVKINSTRIATTIPMMGPVPSAGDPVQNTNMLRNFLMLTGKKRTNNVFPRMH
jgi:hypothetical protein